MIFAEAMAPLAKSDKHPSKFASTKAENGRKVVVIVELVSDL